MCKVKMQLKTGLKMIPDTGEKEISEFGPTQVVQRFHV